MRAIDSSEPSSLKSTITFESNNKESSIPSLFLNINPFIPTVIDCTLVTKAPL